MLARITSAKATGSFRLSLVFEDGTEADVDLRDQIVGRGGVFTALEEPDFFKLVQVDHEAGTVIWPNNVDLDPDVLYSLATSRPVSLPTRAQTA